MPEGPGPSYPLRHSLPELRVRVFHAKQRMAQRFRRIQGLSHALQCKQGMHAPACGFAGIAAATGDLGSRGEDAPLGQRRLDILHLGNRPRYLRRSFIAAP